MAIKDLVMVVSAFQEALRNAAAVLTDQPSGRGGRKLKAIESATELEIVAPARAGSLELDLELAPEPERLALEAQTQPSLGLWALETLVDGLRELDDGVEMLPRGFDRGVLRSIAKVGALFSKGYSSIELTINGSLTPRTARLTEAGVGAIRRMIREPFDAPAAAEGTLQMIDHAAEPILCRLDRVALPSVACRIPREHEALASRAMRQAVRVEGIGRFEPDSDEPRSIDVERLTLLPQPPGVDPDAYRERVSWQRLAEEHVAQPLRSASQLEADLFEDDEDFDRFLTAVRGR